MKVLLVIICFVFYVKSEGSEKSYVICDKNLPTVISDENRNILLEKCENIQNKFLVNVDLFPTRDQTTDVPLQNADIDCLNYTFHTKNEGLNCVQFPIFLNTSENNKLCIKYLKNSESPKEIEINLINFMQSNDIVQHILISNPISGIWEDLCITIDNNLQYDLFMVSNFFEIKTFGM